MSNTPSFRRLLIVAAMLAGAAAAGASRLYAERVADYYQNPQCIADNCNGGSTGCEILPSGIECLKGAAS
jgi:hypothetical protein